MSFKFFQLFQERAEKLFLHYLQRWAKDYLRRRLDWVVDDLVINFVNLKSNLAPLANESHNLLKDVFPSKMPNIAYFPASRRTNLL